MAIQVAVPLLVTVRLFGPLSRIKLAESVAFNNRLVFVIEGSMACGGVNAAVYTAVPLTTRRLEIYPGK